MAEAQEEGSNRIVALRRYLTCKLFEKRPCRKLIQRDRKQEKLLYYHQYFDIDTSNMMMLTERHKEYDKYEAWKLKTNCFTKF